MMKEDTGIEKVISIRWDGSLKTEADIGNLLFMHERYSREQFFMVKHTSGLLIAKRHDDGRPWRLLIRLNDWFKFGLNSSGKTSIMRKEETC